MIGRATTCLASLTAGLALAWPGVSDVRPEPQAQPLVLHCRLQDQAITPVVTRFVTRSIKAAERRGASCLLLELDTPGGLVDATRAMVRAILVAEVPVVVYVPQGGRAASAGLFIALAGHVAAMGPGSNIGAAHPVQMRKRLASGREKTRIRNLTLKQRRKYIHRALRLSTQVV